MPTSYTNIWNDKILKNLKSFLRTEFQASTPVYIGGYRKAGNESLRLVPIESVLIDRSSLNNLRRYSVGVYYYYSLKNVQESSFMEHVLARVSRIEKVFNNNCEIEKTDGNHYFEGILTSTILDAELIDEPEDFSGYIVRWNFNCKNLGI
jgi:hypothetical protein